MTEKTNQEKYEDDIEYHRFMDALVEDEETLELLRYSLVGQEAQNIRNLANVLSEFKHGGKFGFEFRLSIEREDGKQMQFMTATLSRPEFETLLKNIGKYQESHQQLTAYTIQFLRCMYRHHVDCLRWIQDSYNGVNTPKEAPERAPESKL